MENPYSSPPSGNSPFGEISPSLPFQPSPGMVGHVRVIGILMAIQGVCALLMGLFFVAYAFFFPVIMKQMVAQDPKFRQEEFDKMMPFITVVMCAYAALAILPGILQIVAGMKTYRFRNRGLAITGLVVGLVPSITCYCAPTAIGLAVYGFIVLLNPQVMAAFQLGQQGTNGDQILASFYQGRTG